MVEESIPEQDVETRPWIVTRVQESVVDVPVDEDNTYGAAIEIARGMNDWETVDMDATQLYS